MIQIEKISDNILKITPPEKLAIGDFPAIAPQIDAVIAQYGRVKLLIDASSFSGWENIAAFEEHAEFVKKHQKKVARIAVLAAHDWQHWLIGAVRIFVHPEVKAFGASQQAEALTWLGSA
jgi:hypothetical protein